AGNLDNRHVEIVCAALARVNVSVLYQFIDTANRSWPTGVLAASTLGRIAWGSVAPRKVACRLAREGSIVNGSRPSTRARGQPVLPPSNREGGWTPRRTTLLAHRRWSLTREVPMRKSWLLI